MARLAFAKGLTIIVEKWLKSAHTFVTIWKSMAREARVAEQKGGWKMQKELVDPADQNIAQLDAENQKYKAEATPAKSMFVIPVRVREGASTSSRGGPYGHIKNGQGCFD